MVEVNKILIWHLLKFIGDGIMKLRTIGDLLAHLRPLLITSLARMEINNRSG